MKVVVCGTTFGQFYLAALRRGGAPFSLAGILARGSARSRALADRAGVPLFLHPGELPDDIDIACVVVRSGSMGGAGTSLAEALLSRGIHVLQEHPVHGDEIAGCLRVALAHGCRYHINSFYPHLSPVRRFSSSARELLAEQPPLYVDAACAIQVAYPLLDILGRTLGGVRPFHLQPAGDRSRVEQLVDGPFPFRSLDGVIAGVPLTLRVQNQIVAADPDNHLHLLHRISVGVAGGNLTLLNTHGPLVWSARLFVPAVTRARFELDTPEARALQVPSATVLDDSAPAFTHVLGELWPDGVLHALTELRAAIVGDDDTASRGQYHLALCELWQLLTQRLGYPDALVEEVPSPSQLEPFERDPIEDRR